MSFCCHPPGRPAVWGTVVSALLVVVAGLASCAPSTETDPTPPAASAARPAAPTASAVSPAAPSTPPSADVSPTPTPTSAPPSNDSGQPSGVPRPDAVVINVTQQNGRVTPSGDKVTVQLGQTVVLNLVSDTADEVHAHTSGGGREVTLNPGEPTTLTFVADEVGRFEVEMHETETIIVILIVR